MAIHSNEEIRERYRDMEESMTRLVRDRETAFEILWFDIYKWLEPDNTAVKADLCGYLTELLTGVNRGGGIFAPVRDNDERYQEIKSLFCFGNTVNDLGEFWKDLIREEKPFRLRILLAWLMAYHKDIMPYVWAKSAEWWKEVQHDPDAVLPQKGYRAHRATVRANIQIL